MTTPRVGDIVNVYSGVRKEWLEGEVIDLLNKQFTYLEQGKKIKRFCFYDEDWKIITPTSNKPKHRNI